jgi:hypothetical protein
MSRRATSRANRNVAGGATGAGKKEGPAFAGPELLPLYACCCIQTAFAGPQLPLFPASLPGGRGEVGENLLNYSSGTISSATILMILISGLIAGPAVSL